MVYGFVKQSGGHVRIDSEIGRGTVVEIYLPLASTQDVDPPPVRQTAELSRGGESILMVEDHAALLELTELQLTALGYRVRTAENGAAALLLIESGLEIDLLFTDIVMPGGMSGYELAARACAFRPGGFKVLFTSGFAGDAKGAAAFSGYAPLLPKPYRKYELANAMRDALDRPPETNGVPVRPKGDGATVTSAPASLSV